MRRSDLSEPVRARLVRLPAPHQAHYGVVPAPPPEGGVMIGEVARRHQLAIEAMARVEEYARTLHDPYVVSRILARQEAVSSSAIEGTNSTLDELLAEEETRDQEARAAVRQVRRYALALESYVGRAALRGPDIFTTRLISNLHRRLMRDDPDYRDRPGKLRQSTVWIGGGDIAYSTFTPPPADRVEACLEDSVRYMRADGLHAQQQSLITRMAIAHSHFEAVHPFRDGNGRVGRLLLPMMMAAEGRAPLFIATYIEAHRAAYYQALKASQQRLDWSAMVGFLSDAIVGSTEELMGTRAAFSSLVEVWQARRRFRVDSSALRALVLLPQFPVITIARLATVLGVTFPAASRAVDQLQDVGILREGTGHARNRIFVAPEALTILNRPFGEEPVLPER